MNEQASTGLILSGGGARAAYQVGVLAAVSAIRREAGLRGNPFDIFCGTSAGALNASALACHADRFDASVQGLEALWGDLRVEQVYRADAFGVVRTGTRWMTMLSLGWAIRRWRQSQPRSLLDNEPLRALVAQHIRFERLPRLLEAGKLQALAIAGSSYSSGQHVTFFQTAGMEEPWMRSQRTAVRTVIGPDHLLASSAIPFIFPPQPLEIDGHTEWFGDGSMRQSAPISPAIHLGAERVFVIGAGRVLGSTPDLPVHVSRDHPSLAQIAGHALSNIFLDALAVDIERLQRINRTLSLLPAEAREATPLRPVRVLVISPSQRIDDIAAQHQQELPATIRALLGSIGVHGQGRQASGSSLVSYLLFVQGYLRALMDLGRADTLARRDEVLAFFQE